MENDLTNGLVIYFLYFADISILPYYKLNSTHFIFFLRSSYYSFRKLFFSPKFIIVLVTYICYKIYSLANIQCIVLCCIFLNFACVILYCINAVSYYAYHSKSFFYHQTFSGFIHDNTCRSPALIKNNTLCIL